MRHNQSMPQSCVIPVLGYPVVTEAVTWLVRAFGFEERLRIGSHRVQLTVGDGALVVTGASAEAVTAMSHTQSIMVRVDDADAHHARALAAGARIVGAPQDFPYGERQYTAIDPHGYVWTFSQSIADVDPSAWGGELVRPARDAMPQSFDIGVHR